MTTSHFTMGIVCLLAFAQACECEESSPTGDIEAEHQNKDKDEYGGQSEVGNRCGNGQLNKGEECDLGPDNADDGACTSACLLAACGDGLIQAGGEECDDGGLLSGDGCSPTCTREPCSWDVDAVSFPIQVRPGQAVLGEIAFDGNCDLIVGGGEELPYSEALYRVKNDGSVSILVEAEQLAPDSLVVSGITHRRSDNRIYFSVDISDLPGMLYAVDDQDVLHEILPLEDPINSLTVAPASFGNFGDDLIGVQYSPPALVAINVEEGTITPFGPSPTSLSVAAFGPDGTLYVAEWGADRISTVTSEGLFETFYSGLYRPDGLAISHDGTRMFVAYLQQYQGRIDQISIDANPTLTDGVEVELNGGFAPTGIVVSGASHVLYEMPLDNHAAIGMF